MEVTGLFLQGGFQLVKGEGVGTRYLLLPGCGHMVTRVFTFNNIFRL